MFSRYTREDSLEDEQGPASSSMGTELGGYPSWCSRVCEAVGEGAGVALWAALSLDLCV